MGQKTNKFEKRPKKGKTKNWALLRSKNTDLAQYLKNLSSRMVANSSLFETLTQTYRYISRSNNLTDICLLYFILSKLC